LPVKQPSNNKYRCCENYYLENFNPIHESLVQIKILILDSFFSVAKVAKIANFLKGS